MRTFPNIQSAVMAWARQTKVFIVAKKQVDFLTTENLIERQVKLVRIPTGQSLSMQPEGQRSWNSETIYSEISLDLSVDDIIILDCDKTGARYRVIGKTDYGQYGYLQYEILSDYTKGN